MDYYVRQSAGEALQSTFLLSPRSYTAILFADVVTSMVVNEGSPDEYMFGFDRGKICYLPFEVVASPPEIVEFISQSASGGSLVGTGPRASATRQVDAVRRMIERANDLILIGDTAGACLQLADAYGKTDGLPKPPDLVAGKSAADLAGMISDLMDAANPLIP